jgi:hypothetical protein
MSGARMMGEASSARAFAGAVLMAAFIVIVLADTGDLGFLHAAYDFPGGDKAGHFVLFGMLSLLTNAGIRQAGRASRIAT